MKTIRRLRPSPAMVVACIALLLATSGTGYAVTRLPRNSVTTFQVKDFSLLARDFKRNQLPRGAPGPQGPAGPAGPAGPTGPAGSAASKWALVRPDGGIVAQSGGITLASKPSAGAYVLNVGGAVTGKAIVTAGAYASDPSTQRGETTAGPCGGGSQGIDCPLPNTSSSVFVQTRNNNGTPADHSFYIAILG